MLKAIQILGCSSSLVTQRWKPFSSQGLPSIAISFKPFSSFYAVSFLKALPTMDSSLLPKDSTPMSQSRSIHASSARSDSNPDGTSSSPPSPSLAVQSSGVRNIKFCQWCGGPTKHDIPEGEERLRAICTICGKIIYQNPKMDASCGVFGNWRVSHGRCYQGNKGGSKCRSGSTVSFCSIGHSSNWPKSSECRLFSLDDIPFDSLSFSSMVVTLSMYAEDIKSGKLKFHYGVINKRLGTSPSDIHAYTLDNHMQS
ncbi:nudix hydrolase 23, chloroplastic isoform X3 [Neltuma alba]|uniref:nudix hydrolase 23, chloroplastic isoform X3 n=1 Tax=Neltuma alba TaxID=207710 RepID=UPI0010A57BF8|nr:nudix hydrolase 23, chloroplastic isoform X3 [Prosopis alba]XP_028787738.1 nudix hydrolase 23, chloroplastic isoform X3 [Prosopis alba]